MKAKYFDPDKTLEQIAQIFATYGYEGTTLDVIIKETGVGKQSLYNAYGDKKTMIDKALQSYGKNTNIGQILTSNLTGRKKIDLFFETILSECAEDGGCLVTNQLLEKAGTDKRVQKAASQKWQQTRALFKVAVEQGIKDKSIKTKIDPEILSYAIMNLLNGIRVTVRATNDSDKIKKSVKTTLDSLL